MANDGTGNYRIAQVVWWGADREHTRYAVEKEYKFLFFNYWIRISNHEHPDKETAEEEMNFHKQHKNWYYTQYV